uniref:Uncharacterized protein n=1 Tax=viral metagenome TaxID=1070528 RepID=A0A6C0HD37_9ZZZZ
MSADTTSINDLPADPASGVSGNISLSVNEMKQTADPQSSPALALDQTTINQIVNGLQQASATGATQLMSRDIPQNTQGYTQDAQIQPTYIPQSSNVDYIKDYEDNADIINNYNRRMDNSNTLDQLYDELQIPLLIAVLFFLFQLPIFKKFLFQYFPILFFKDGNVNIYGYVFTSVLFGLLYYLLFKIMTHFSKF